jgi:small-conductance mechanosensitive channel
MENFVSEWLLDPLVGKLLGAVVGILIIHLLVRAVNRAIAPRIKDTDARYRLRKLITFIGYAAGILLLAAVFSDRLGRLTVVVGLAGAGVAFALQEVILSIAGWATITFGGFFRVGDRIQLGGIKGDLIDIGVLRSTLMECGEWVRADQYNGRIVRVANSFVFKDPVYNYSADFPFLWDEITVPIRYGSRPELARKLLLEAASQVVGDYSASAMAGWKSVVNRYRIEDASVEPMVTMTANDNWMEFTLRYVVDYKRRRTTKDQLWQHVLDGMDKSNGSVALGLATFGLAEAPALDVTMRHAIKG